jgi:hypothetical protein
MHWLRLGRYLGHTNRYGLFSEPKTPSSDRIHSNGCKIGDP